MTDFSESFPILKELTFLNHAAVAPLSKPAAQALRWYAERASNHAYVQSGWYEKLDQLRESSARLIHARGAHEVAFVPNTSAGLNLVSGGLDFQPGDQVVISNVEYPANRYPWEALKRLGVDVIEVEQRDDFRIDEDDVIDAITDLTRVVSISHVQFSTGFRCDLKRISDIAHQASAYLCVDAIQSVGVLPVDVQAMGIDFLSADGHKWMLGPEGAGIFYCHEELIELLRPQVVGWLNMVNAMDFLAYQFEYRKDAQRFESGSWNVPGLLALQASIDLLLEVGIDEIYARVDALNMRLRQGLAEQGWRVISPPEPEERSGIVVFEPGRDHADMNLKKVAGDLEQQGIILALRNGRLRASPHFYNTPDQIDRVLDAIL